MASLVYTREKEMYPHVKLWLKSVLQASNTHADVTTYDTSKIALRRFLESKGLQGFFPQYQSYDIHVDVTGVVKFKDRVHLAFVECKLKPIGCEISPNFLGTVE